MYLDTDILPSVNPAIKSKSKDETKKAAKTTRLDLLLPCAPASTSTSYSNYTEHTLKNHCDFDLHMAVTGGDRKNGRTAANPTPQFCILNPRCVPVRGIVLFLDMYILTYLHPGNTKVVKPKLLEPRGIMPGECTLDLAIRGRFNY